MKLLIAHLILLTAMFLAFGRSDASQLSKACAQDAIIVNTVEKIILLGTRPKQIRALIDTGATYSSMDKLLAKKLGLKETGGYVEIRNAHGTRKRPLVSISFVIKGQKREDRFTLSDRHNLEYPVLIGRSSLSGFLIKPE